ncbi:hypothetical protein L211DRAFT_319065 [Terfezia boudieri ATCC MYA-4762]|uniref:GPI inositol-deacylase winged helix domain-containing protein n=1 Tax=Terfezia boudieri ATCC MYA-4762 TaxID=1051890 RepID=A0A3N4LMY9_9PEZI|nr:hypothetical protein L211DRAFT_319065 [Terfezia boudieri ATCC MYA-4762]
MSREIKLEGAFNKLVNLRIRIGKTDNRVDINHYIISELNQVRGKLEPHIHLEEGYARELIETLTVRAEGMFLWVRLVIGSFLNATRLKDIEEGVRNLPHGLDQAYGRILKQIVERSHANSKQHQETLIILKWLACAFRPITLSEVKSWLAIDVQSSRHVSRPSIVEGGLITEILPDSTIQFVHFSAKEWVIGYVSR